MFVPHVPSEDPVGTARAFDRALLLSLALLAGILSIALTGLALDGNWGKVLRVGVAGMTYVGVLLVLRAQRAKPLGYGAFVAAGLAAGTASGGLHPGLGAEAMLTAAVATAFLPTALHYGGLRSWRPLLRAIVAPTLSAGEGVRPSR